MLRRLSAIDSSDSCLVRHLLTSWQPASTYLHMCKGIDVAGIQDFTVYNSRATEMSHEKNKISSILSLSVYRCSRLFCLSVYSADDHRAGGALPRGSGREGNNEHPAGQSRHVPRLRDRTRVQVGGRGRSRFS